MTIFAVYFPIKVVVRIWDIFLVEGRKTIFRFALAILKVNEKQFLSGEMEVALLQMKKYQKDVDVEELIKVATNTFTFSKDHLFKLSEEY